MTQTPTIPPEWAEIVRKVAVADELLRELHRLAFEADSTVDIPKSHIGRARAAIAKARGGLA